MINPLLARFDCEPALVAPEFQARFESCLAAVMGSDHRAVMLGSAAASGDDTFWSDDPTNWRSVLRPYIVRDGVLQIPVKGVLLNDFPYAFGSWATGYAYIRRAFDRGMSDGNVRGIALVCDTPGGMVAGNFDLADRIFAARGPKPIRAFAHEAAYSAGYSIASAADRIVVSRSGGVGSIGVVTMHRDVSKALDEAGIKITLVYAGAHKVDGNPFAPLPEAVRDRIQARVETTWSEFVAIVARNRGLTDEAVRATQALTYTARDALAVRLADEIGSLDDAVAAFAASIIPPEAEEDEMSTTDKNAQDAALAAARQEGAEGGRREGAAAASTRIKTIMTSEHAEGRSKLASYLAHDTDMTAEQAIAALQNAEKTAPQGSRLDGVVPDPKVAADASATGAANATDSTAGLQAAVDKMVGDLPKGR